MFFERVVELVGATETKRKGPWCDQGVGQQFNRWGFGMMNKLFLSRPGNAVAHGLLVLLLSGCAPVMLKTVELQPLTTTTGTSGESGSFGFCASQGKTPATTFSPAPAQMMVGYDDFFRAGTQPFACDDVRVSVFRGGVKFDLSQFDSIVKAELLLDTVKSVSRSDGKLISNPSSISYASQLCVATEIFSSQMLCDNDVLLPVGETIGVGVSNQVRDWVSMRRNNFGFVLGGPRPPFPAKSPPRDNDAKISWYNNFRLRITYKATLNPRAPQ